MNMNAIISCHGEIKSNCFFLPKNVKLYFYTPLGQILFNDQAYQILDDLLKGYNPGMADHVIFGGKYTQNYKLWNGNFAPSTNGNEANGVIICTNDSDNVFDAMSGETYLGTIVTNLIGCYGNDVQIDVHCLFCRT